MKIYIETSGDSSVGVQADLIEIDYPFLEDFIDSEYRKDLRERLTKFWKEELDNTSTYVRFEDEEEEQ